MDFGPAGSALRQAPELPRIISALWNLTACPGSFAKTKEELTRMWWGYWQIAVDVSRLQRRNLQLSTNRCRLVDLREPLPAGWSGGWEPPECDWSKGSVPAVLYLNNHSDLNHTLLLFIQYFVLPAVCVKLSPRWWDPSHLQDRNVIIKLEKTLNSSLKTKQTDWQSISFPNQSIGFEDAQYLPPNTASVNHWAKVYLTGSRPNDGQMESLRTCSETIPSLICLLL